MPTKKTTPGRLNYYSAQFRGLTLPAEAWRGLFLVTLNRLRRVRPAWADFTAEQVTNFELTHLIRYKHTNPPRRAHWIADALTEMESCALPDGRGRKRPDVHPSLYLRHYTKIKRYFDAHPSATEGTDKETRALLRRVFDTLALVGRNAKVTEALVRKVRQLSPADLAYEILYHVYGVDPAYLEKKVFPKLRKSRSALEEWEREITSSPLFPS